jgi:glucose/arabinose dehydrogenase
MKHRVRVRESLRIVLLGALLLAFGADSGYPYPQGGRGAVPLGEGPWVFETFEPATRIRVSVVTRGLDHPWSMAWLPSGDMLITERRGRLRLFRDGVLDAEPVDGVPEVLPAGLGGLLDIALDPEFDRNQRVYFTYTKVQEDDLTTALARGRFDGEALVDVEDVFLARNAGGRGAASRILFGADGALYMSIGGAGAPGDERSQDPLSHKGKLLRLTPEGAPPADNPFVGREGYLPEIFSMGHRNQEGLALHPSTGAVWASEQGPQGGDEVNIIEAGANYGWPVVTYGREYDGRPASDQPWRADLKAPEIFWVPSIATSGLAFYTGDAFPGWKGNLFAGGMVEARIAGTGQLQRIVFNENGEVRREALLRDLHQRIRDVRQGPDGLLYLLTDEAEGALLRIEPAP